MSDSGDLSVLVPVALLIVIGLGWWHFSRTGFASQDAGSR
jgi:hypothetical protein